MFNRELLFSFWCGGGAYTYLLTHMTEVSLTFPVQPLQLLMELVYEAADGGADGSQVQVSVDADP